MKKIFVMVSVLLLIYNTQVFAMENPIYSYIVNGEGIELLSATLPYDTEIMDIPAEINSKPVWYLDDGFAIYQENNLENDFQTGTKTRSITYIPKSFSSTYTLKKIIVPQSLRVLNGAMLERFQPTHGVMGIEIVYPGGISVDNTASYYSSGDEIAWYRRRHGKIAPVNAILPNDGTAVSVYVGDDKIEGCVLYNNITYIPCLNFKDSAKAEPKISIGSSREIEQDVMSFMCPVVGTHKYLDYIGEYTDKEKSEYTEMGKRIIANASANEVMIMEYYKHTDENVPIIRGGIRGGEVKIIDVPVFPGYIPLRAAFENLDYDVTWDNETHTVYVSTPEIEAE